MTASLAALRPLVFAALAVAAVAAEYAVVASRGFALHPTGFSAAVIFDLVVGLPLAWWLLVVRPGAARPRTLVPVALAGLAVAAALLPGERGLLRGLRFLAIPAGAGDVLGPPPQRVDRRLRGGALHVPARDGWPAPLDRTLVAIRGLGRDRAGRLRSE